MPDRRSFCTMLLLAGLTATTASPVLAETPQPGGTLRIATLGLDTADPHRHTGSISVQQVYVEALTSIADDGSVKPFLAESFEMSADGKTYTFQIRDDVLFHNGRELSAQDVLANFERVKNEVSGGWLASAMQKIDGLEAPSERTFVVRLSEAYAPFLNLISELWILAPDSPGWDGTIETPIGTGPFAFGSWVPQVELIAPRHEQYWMAGQPYLDAVHFDLSDGGDRSLALRSGDLHIASVDRDQLPLLAQDDAISIQQLKDTSWYFWSFNNRSPRPPFDNVRVREAIPYALDKPAYISFIAGEQGVVTNQMVIPGNFYFDQALHDADKHAAPDLALAKQILGEEGVDPSAITLRVVSWQNAYSEVAAQMVRELGFAIEHIALDDLGAQQRLGEFDWDLAPFGSGPRADIFLRYVRMMSDGPNPVLWGGVQSEAYDGIVSAAVAEPDPETRRRLYLDAWQLVMDNYWTVVAGHAANVIAVRDEVKGFTPGFTWSTHRVDGGLAFTWLEAG
jgi:ABC-type transport system substrate-binding protein